MDAITGLSVTPRYSPAAKRRLRKRELRNETFHLRIQQQGGQLENPSQLRSIRREVARIETVINEKKKAAAAAAK